jgi:hypothetical protein
LAQSDSPAPPAEPHEGFFHHLLDVVNPLLHLPVIGTIYRAITGERLDAVEKIAGDTLYGGLWGAVASIADVAFEGLTGKSFEDTAPGAVQRQQCNQGRRRESRGPTISANISLPSAELPSLPNSGVLAANSPAAAGFDVMALTNALSAKGVDSETAGRALYAYRRSMGLTAPIPVLASVH